MAVNSMAALRTARYNAFRWRDSLGIAQKVALALAFAGLTGLAAQVRIPLPWTPVPITAQTFAVLLAGVLLGRWWGGISMGFYAGLGVAGVPWFTGWSGGLSHLAGPTGGYILGFILAALVVGYVMDTFPRARHILPLLGLMLGANFLLVYIPGVLQLGLWLNIIQGKAVGISQAIAMGFLPFVVGDIVKVVAAALAARAATPR